MRRRRIFKQRSPLPKGADLVEFDNFTDAGVVVHLRASLRLLEQAYEHAKKALPLAQYGYEKFTINSILAGLRDAKYKLEKHAKKNA